MGRRSPSPGIVVIGHSLLRESDAVAEAGLRLARGLGAQPLEVHASTEARERLRVLETGAPPGDDGAVRGEHRAQLRERLAARIAPHQAPLSGAPPPSANRSAAGALVVDGPPHESLNRVAREVGADLLFVGAHERRGFPFGIIGSTVDRLLRTTERPMFVLRAELLLPPRRVVVAVDLSPQSFEALRCAERVLQPLRNDSLGDSREEVLTVIDPSEQPRPLPTGQLDDAVLGELRKLVALYSDLPSHALELVVRHGDVRQEILDELEFRHADLVVVAAHGCGGSSRFRLVGKVADEIVRRAPCNILFVPVAAAYVEAQSFCSLRRDKGRRPRAGTRSHPSRSRTRNDRPADRRKEANS